MPRRCSTTWRSEPYRYWFEQATPCDYGPPASTLRTSLHCHEETGNHWTYQRDSGSGLGSAGQMPIEHRHLGSFDGGQPQRLGDCRTGK